MMKPKEKSTPVTFYRIEAICNNCGTGTLEPDKFDQYADGFMSSILHRCDNCQKETYLETRYPYMREKATE